MQKRMKARQARLLRTIENGSLALAIGLWLALAGLFVYLAVALTANRVWLLGLFAASSFFPFILSGIVEAALTRLMCPRFRPGVH
ncbi:MAG: hypothetical protein H7A21_06030 [Spirochaetales bacterium]|nr:hypothetical protein [Leptospiraceae bacterium]MCP5480969.1 hypothetical protein [Spirochaetales bacterium]MCP5485349.1 hypothetical protein [Spirochaetales bacterium]